MGVLRPRSVSKLLMFGLALALASCSDGKPALNPVHGRVLFKDAPASGVLVTLHLVGADAATSQPSTGYTDGEGKFEIVSGQDEGAPAGEYVVTMIWMQDLPGAKKTGPGFQRDESPRADKLKGRYSDTKKSAFPSVTIKKGVVNELEPFRLQ
jgi:hypothetical protein